MHRYFTEHFAHQPSSDFARNSPYPALPDNTFLGSEQGRFRLKGSFDAEDLASSHKTQLLMKNSLIRAHASDCHGLLALDGPARYLSRDPTEFHKRKGPHAIPREHGTKRGWHRSLNWILELCRPLANKVCCPPTQIAIRCVRGSITERWLMGQDPQHKNRQTFSRLASVQ